MPLLRLKSTLTGLALTILMAAFNPARADTVTFNITAGIISDADGTPLNAGLIQLIAKKPGTGANFAAPTATSFVGGDANEVMVASFPLTLNLGVSGEFTSSVSSVDLASLGGSGGPLLLRWYPSLNSGSTAPGITSYGQYTSATATTDGDPWIVPSTGLIDLSFLTHSVDSASPLPDSLGRAALTSVVGPLVGTQPQNQTAGSGQTVVFAVAATGAGTLDYQWNFNGAPISGATDRYLVLTNAQAADAGGYSCTVTDATTGSITSAAAALTVSSSTDLGRIINVSVRNNDGAGDSQLIAGFVIGGEGNDGSAKTVLVRGDGPLLASLGLSGTLPDPLLNLFQPSVSTTSSLASNQGWNDDSAIASLETQVGAYPLPAGSLDAALSASLPAGAYTANVTGASGDSGIALAEVYDATTGFTATTPRLINVSGRCVAGTGDSQLIAGFVIDGSTEKTVLVRGDGPLLASLGLANTLPDPVVSVFQPSVSTTVPLASNTIWGGDPALSAVGTAVGAYPFASPASADSALLISLPPGAYTANVTGASGDTGIALVEVYEVP